MSASLAGQRICIKGANAGISPVADVNNTVADRYATRSLRALATAVFDLVCGKVRDFTNAVVIGIHEVHRADIDRRHPYKPVAGS